MQQTHSGSQPGSSSTTPPRKRGLKGGRPVTHRAFSVGLRKSERDIFHVAQLELCLDSSLFGSEEFLSAIIFPPSSLTPCDSECGFGASCVGISSQKCRMWGRALDPWIRSQVIWSHVKLEKAALDPFSLLPALTLPLDPEGQRDQECKCPWHLAP